MAIEGISSAVNMNSTQIKSQTRMSDSAMVAATTGQIKVETVKPVESKGSSSFGSSQNAKEDRAQVQSDKEISPERVKSAVDDLNKQIKSNLRHTSLSFKYHDDTNRISITVTDSDTDEVIREIPPEKALDMLAKAWEMAGLLVDEKR